MRPASIAQLQQLGYPIADDGMMRMPPAPRWPVDPPPLEEQFAALFSMTPAERVAAMYRGELTYTQLCKWAARYPSELALVDGEFVFIAAQLPDYEDSPTVRVSVPTAQAA